MNIKSLILALVPLLAAGCSDEVPYVPVPVQQDGALSVPYEVDGQMPVISRGVPTVAHETKLGKAYVLFFDASNSDSFAGYVAVSPQPGKNTLSFDPPTSVEAGKGYRVLAIGNADEYTPGGNYGAEVLSRFSGTMADAKGELMVHFKEAMTYSTPGVLPMFGSYVDSDGEAMLFETTRGAVKVENPGRMYFSRAVCRIDIHNLVGHILDVKCARIVNGRTAGMLFMDGVNAGDQPEITPQTAPDGKGYVAMAPGENTTQRLEGALYAFPNTVGTTVVNDKVTTALLLAGYYTDPQTGVKDTELTYYRFNLANAGDIQALRRNYCYRATIKGVRRRGSTDEKTAYNDASPIFDYNLDEVWDTSEDNVATDQDGNFLIVNRTHLTFKGDATTADFVELRVSTNPQLDWHVEWVAQDGHSNDKFTFEKLDAQAVKCGPTEVNDTRYVRYGYIKIVARNSETGKTLEMPVYLVQLSVYNNVRCLTVNDSTGKIEVKLDPMGTTVNLKVVTGSVGNIWEVEDVNGSLRSWDSNGVDYTRDGDNGTNLVIKVPANLSDEARTAKLIVRLTEDPEGKVQPVEVNLVQEASPQLMDIVNYPEGGTLSLQCLDLTDFENQGGVVNDRNFIVRLTNAAYRYKVESTFDPTRDLILSDVRRNKTSVNPAVAGQGTMTINDDLTDMTNNSQFYINPFRMGPNDPPITGTITVKAYNPDDATARTETRKFEVTLWAQEVEINDVVMTNGDGYVLVADRNVGAPARHQGEGMADNTALYYDSREEFKITGMNSNNDPRNNTNYLGTLTTHLGDKHYAVQTLDPTEEQSVSDFIGSANSPNFLYESTEGWGIPDDDNVVAVGSRGIVSKGRVFLVSEKTMRKRGKEIPVVCWMPFNDWSADPYGQFGPHASKFIGAFRGWHYGGNYGEIFLIFWNDKNVCSLYTGQPNKFKGWNSGHQGTNEYRYASTTDQTRLVRDMTAEEFARYDKEVLGH